MREKITIPIMFCFDKNYLIPACVAAYSLLENAARSVECGESYRKSCGENCPEIYDNIYDGGGGRG